MANFANLVGFGGDRTIRCSKSRGHEDVFARGSRCLLARESREQPIYCGAMGIFAHHKVCSRMREPRL